MKNNLERMDLDSLKGQVSPRIQSILTGHDADRPYTRISDGQSSFLHPQHTRRFGMNIPTAPHFCADGYEYHTNYSRASAGGSTVLAPTHDVNVSIGVMDVIRKACNIREHAERGNQHTEYYVRFTYESEDQRGVVGARVEVYIDIDTTTEQHAKSVYVKMDKQEWRNFGTPGLRLDGLVDDVSKAFVDGTFDAELLVASAARDVVPE